MQLSRYIFHLRVRSLGETKTLSIVLPIVFYDGKRPWNNPTDMRKIAECTGLSLEKLEKISKEIEKRVSNLALEHSVTGHEIPSRFTHFFE